MQCALIPISAILGGLLVVLFEMYLLYTPDGSTDLYLLTLNQQ